MTFRLFFLAFAISCSQLSFAEYEPGNAKFYQLKYKGIVSHILGTDHALHPDTVHIPLSIMIALKNSDQVIVESIKYLEAPPGYLEAPFHPAVFTGSNSLESKLRAKPRETARLLMKGTPAALAYLDFKPGAVLWWAAKSAALISGEHLEILKKGVENPESMDPRLNPVFTFSPGILKLAEKAAGRPITGLELTANNIKGAATRPSGGLDAYIMSVAKILGKPISGLSHTEPYSSHFEEYLDLVSYDDLNRGLVALALKTDMKSTASSYMNHLAGLEAQYLARQKFFTIENRILIEMNEEIGKDKWAFRAGQERLIDYEFARHTYWVDEMMQQLSERKTFFAVGAAHVLGGKKFKSLVALLRERGVEVTPVQSCEDSAR